GGRASGNQYYSSYGGPHYSPTPPQYSHRPHPHSLPAHVHGGMSQSSSNCANHVPHQAPGSSPVLSRDERAMRMRNRVRKKLQQRRVTSNEGFYPGTRPQTGRRSRVNEEMGFHGEMGLSPGQGTVLDNGPLDIEEENSMLIQCLSAMPAPKVTGVEARTSLIQLSPPDCDGAEVDLDLYDVKYELLLSDKGRDAKYKTVFCGDATEITLKDLKPATEYHLKVCAMLTEELKGALAEPVSFRTLTCEPDTPQPPKLISKTKTSLLLKWNAACENGSKITAYSLECDQGDGSFSEVYSGAQRQFKVPQLNASTRYSFRLAAINNSGKSAYSEEVSFFTSGSAPSQPDPPMLSEQFVYALTISWIRRPNDDEFLLQMEDETTGHGFITVYNGQSLSTVIRNLKRNMEYKFRLGAKNEEGQSKWSEAVSYRTQPDKPHPPSKPQIKGKMGPYSFRVTWDPPQDTGGSDITKYILELDNSQGYDTVYEGCEREHQFDHLLPGTLYHVRVACCSAGGRSEFSPACVATTLPIIPGQCQTPKLQGKPKATSLHLRWCNPDYDGGSQVTHFSAQMISPDNSSREVYKGHDRDCIVAGLLPGRPYLFQVRAFNRVGAGPWSEPLEVVSGAGVPDEPRMPHVTSRSAHSALVTWEEPLNNGASISEYRLEWQQQSDTSDFSQLYLGPNLCYEVKGLAAATVYAFRIQAINSAGPGQFSPAATLVTPASTPSPVATVKVKADATSAVVSWTEPNCNGSEITSYNIIVNDKPPVTLGPITEYSMEDLHPETVYKIRIQAVNSVGVGAYSSAVKFSTKAQPPVPPHLECVMLASCSIKLKWGDGRNSDHLTYTLEMGKDQDSFQPVYTGPAQTHKVTRLTELTSYEFRIVATNDAGSGPYSDTYTFTTTKAPPPPLKAPRVTNLTLHGCHLDWQAAKPMSGDPVTYILQLLCVNVRDAEYKQIYKGPHTEYQLDSLQPGQEYQVRVAAVRLSSDGSGDITGAFSPGVIFSPRAAESQRAASNPVLGQVERREERRPWSDQQYAAMILCIFVLLAIVSAFVCQQLISYMSGSETTAPSTSTSTTLGTGDSTEA
ncbi:unnamed protein product, partial [Candidula unifasciata]